MPSEKLDTLKAELEAAMALILPQIEGLEDFARLNIKEDTKSNVNTTLARFVKRRSRLQAALQAMQGLDEDNYPDLPSQQVAQSVFNDLQENVTTIAAAFAKFTPERATVLGVEVGSPVPKE